MEQQVDFMRGDYRLFGMLHRPEGRLHGGVLFLHGFGGHRAESGRLFVRTARRLAQKGLASLRFDFAGSGDSEGEDVDSTILTQVEDSVAAARFFTERTALEPCALGAVGYSLGGATAAVLSERVAFEALVLWAAVSEPIRNFSEFYEVPADELSRMNGYEVGARRVGARFLAELPKVQPLKVMQAYPGALLTVQGLKDEVVRPYNSDRYIEAAVSAKAAEQVHIESAGHGFGGWENSETLIDETVRWFETHLGR